MGPQMSAREATARIKIDTLPEVAGRRSFSQDGQLRVIGASNAIKTANSRVARASAQTNMGQGAIVKPGRPATIMPIGCSMNLIKSKKRVADHGEVFTPRVDGRSDARPRQGRDRAH